MELVTTPIRSALHMCPKCSALRAAGVAGLTVAGLTITIEQWHCTSRTMNVLQAISRASSRLPASRPEGHALQILLQRCSALPQSAACRAFSGTADDDSKGNIGLVPEDTGPFSPDVGDADRCKTTLFCKRSRQLAQLGRTAAIR